MKAGSMQKGSWKTVDWAGYGVAAFVLVGSAVAFFRPALRLGGRPGARDLRRPSSAGARPRRQPMARGGEAGRRGPRRAHGPRRARAGARRSCCTTRTSAGSSPSRSRAGASRTTSCPTTRPGSPRLIRKGELVEVKPVTDDYVLYGVGANATGEPLTHYDVAVRPRGHAVPAMGRLRRRARGPARRDRGEEGGRRGQARRVPQDHRPRRGPAADAAPPSTRRSAPRRPGWPPSSGASRPRPRPTTTTSGGGCSSRNGRSSQAAGPGLRPPRLRPRPAERPPRLPRAPAELHPAGGAGGDGRHRAAVPRAVRPAARLYVAHPQRALPAPARRDQRQRHEDRGPAAHHGPRLRHLLPVHDRRRAALRSWA